MQIVLLLKEKAILFVFYLNKFAKYKERYHRIFYGEPKTIKKGLNNSKLSYN